MREALAGVPFVWSEAQMARVTRRTLSNVNSSAIIARQPDVPKRIAIFDRPRRAFLAEAQDSVLTNSERHKRMYINDVQSFVAQEFSDKVAGM
jgi:hypothetical protein